jgi:hypothetical protein
VVVVGGGGGLVGGGLVGGGLVGGGLAGGGFEPPPPELFADELPDEPLDDGAGELELPPTGVAAGAPGVAVEFD